MIPQSLKLKHLKLMLLPLVLIAFGCSNDDDNTPKEPGNNTQTENTILKVEDLTLEEKVGQMFLVHPEELSDANPCIEVDQTMKANLGKCPVGGIILFAANVKNPTQLSKLTREFKAACKYPPFIAIDEEGGSVARIASNSSFNVERFTSMQDIGNTGDPTKAYYVGRTIGDYLQLYGVNVNLAPVADVFSNPNNKVIGKRSFGTTPQVVSPMVSACIDGLHSKGIMTAIKHFPGHGDTDTDSHTSLPLVTKTWDELLECEIIPFRNNMNLTDMIMTAHIAVTSVNEQIDGKTVPSTLSYNMLTNKLRGELGYKGIIITDAMRMAAITNFYEKQGDAAVQAIKAGVDIILCPSSLLTPDGPYFSVIKAVRNGEISEERINQSVSRILELKNQWKD